MDEIEVVRIGPEDWAELREVRLASLQDSPAAFGSTYAQWADAPEERWRARLETVPLHLVARHGDRPVGLVSGTPDGETLGRPAVELISMWVAPSLRGSGVARRLVDGVVSWAAAQGRPTFLMVRVGNDRARAAYERAGFVDLGVPDGFPSGVPLERRMLRDV